MKRLILAGLLSVVLVASTIIQATAGNGNQDKRQEKVDICHWSEEGNKYIPITVAAPAVKAHRDHGDVGSEIGMCDDGLDNDCDRLVDNEDPDCDGPEALPKTKTCYYDELIVCILKMGGLGGMGVLPPSDCYTDCRDYANVYDACSIPVSNGCRDTIISNSDCICD